MLAAQKDKNQSPSQMELEKIEQGFVLSCTPRIQGSTNEITIEYTLETSTQDPQIKRKKKDLPTIIRNTQKGQFTVEKDTAYLASCGSHDGKDMFIYIKPMLMKDALQSKTN